MITFEEVVEVVLKQVIRASTAETEMTKLKEEIKVLHRDLASTRESLKKLQETKS